VSSIKTGYGLIAKSRALTWARLFADVNSGADGFRKKSDKTENP
jgi:hypothetical protein